MSDATELRIAPTPELDEVVLELVGGSADRAETPRPLGAFLRRSVFRCIIGSPSCNGCRTRPGFAGVAV